MPQFGRLNEDNFTTMSPINAIIQKSWSVYQMLNQMHCVIQNVIPILWFGDLDAYCNSSIRIVTIGLNPSNFEFQDKPCESFNVNLRFPAANAIIGKSKLSSKELIIYRFAMNNYFIINPYINWFKWHESALRQLCATYGGKMSRLNFSNNNDSQVHFTNTAIHIDIETPIPTNPTWGNLCKDCRQKITNLSADIFKRLINVLNPHVIIIASNAHIANTHFGISSKGFDSNLSYNKHSSNYLYLPNTDSSHTVSYIRTYTTLPDYTLLWVKNYNGTPFGGMKLNDPNKNTTLIAINKHIQNKFFNTKPIIL